MLFEQRMNKKKNQYHTFNIALWWILCFSRSSLVSNTVSGIGTSVANTFKVALMVCAFPGLREFSASPTNREANTNNNKN